MAQDSTLQRSYTFRSLSEDHARLFLFFMSFVVSTTAGCQFAPKQPLSVPWGKNNQKKQPTRILPVWTDTVLYQTDRPGVRGFGGRIYFYEEQRSEPIEVDGGLAVYVFDADNAEPQDQKPLRKFVFTPEQFSEHMSITSIGPSYSVWLPWGEVGGPPRRLSLIARFEGSEGGTVISDPTIKLLPGVAKSKQPSQASQHLQASSSSIQLASHSGRNTSSGGGSHYDGFRNESMRIGIDEPSASSATLRKRSVDTIDLPPSFQRHLLLNWQPQSELLEDAIGSPQDDTPLKSNQQCPGVTAVDSFEGSHPAASRLTNTDVNARFGWSKNPTVPAAYAGSRTKRDIRQGKWIESAR
ncbi:MAG: hypothetical protein NXI32_11020 [bacterium]|nr:hypothetical protein [bacterium]